jgi:holo-[acyl-carrier protein] synthase
MPVRVGLDLVAVEAVAESVARHARRYLERVYTEAELRDCRRPDGTPDPSRLAARFAAKEAALKAIGHRDDAVPWRSIAVVRGDSGDPSLELTGPAARLARDRGIEELHVSITHEGPFAAAVVIASLGATR